MKMPNPGGRAGAGGDRDVWQDFATKIAQPSQPDNQQPLERYEPLPDDKLVLFALAPVHRLVGRWQGPGTIAELRSARRP